MADNIQKGAITFAARRHNVNVRLSNEQLYLPYIR